MSIRTGAEAETCPTMQWVHGEEKTASANEIFCNISQKMFSPNLHLRDGL